MSSATHSATFAAGPMGMRVGTPNLTVTEVVAGGAAAKAGVKLGMTVATVGGKSFSGDDKQLAAHLSTVARPVTIGFGTSASNDGAYVLSYFTVWAKGPAPCLALNHSGLKWKGGDEHYGQKFERYADCWLGRDKANTIWGELPVLTGPNGGTVGQEG